MCLFERSVSQQGYRTTQTCQSLISVLFWGICSIYGNHLFFKPSFPVYFELSFQNDYGLERLQHFDPYGPGAVIPFMLGAGAVN